jgi:type VI secretion system protein ImpM
MSSALQVGFFGKLPVLGDFLIRRLGSDFLTPWDLWLQQGMTAARTQLGASWTQYYQSAAPWRFALEAGACGPQAVIGVWMAGSDRVGRQFPMTIACALPSERGALETATAADAWFAAAEALATDGVGGQLAAEQFDAEVGALAGVLESTALAFAPAADLDACAQYLRAHGAFRLPLTPGGFGAALNGMCAAQLARFAPPLAAFWCESTTAEPTLYASRGLPAPLLWAEWLRLPRVATSTLLAAAPPAPAAAPPAPPVAATAPISPRASARSPPSAGLLGSLVAEGSASRWQHAVMAGAAPGAALAVAAIAGDTDARVNDQLGRVGALLRQWSPEASDALIDGLGALLRAPQDGAIHLAACLPQGGGHVFLWSGGGSVFRLRARKLERLVADDVPEAPLEGGSLLDLLQPTEAGISEDQSQLLKVARIAATPLQDRYLLCADATYASLSWGQLVSALEESAPEFAAERLREAAGVRIESAAPALVLMFEGSPEAPAARVANTLRAEAPALAQGGAACS